MTIPLNGGVKVNVPEEYFEKALQRIEEMNRIEDVVTALEAETGSLDMCPKCGSKYLEPTRYSLWFLLPAILSWTPLFLRRKKWQCKSCGHKLK